MGNNKLDCGSVCTEISAYQTAVEILANIKADCGLVCTAILGYETVVEIHDGKITNWSAVQYVQQY